jgi:hypothetical protein
MQKKLLPLFFTCFSFFCIKKSDAQHVHFDGQFRYFSEINKVYLRIESTVPITKKIALCGGLSEDGLQMITLCGQYTLFDWLKVKLGTGYHKQNGIHGVFGIKTEHETKKIRIEGYVNGYLDHVSLYASEFEFLKKFKSFDVGAVTDIEYGKFLPLWKEVQSEIFREKLFLIGIMTRVHINKHLSMKLFIMGGQEQIGHDPAIIACKAGFGICYNGH